MLEHSYNATHYYIVRSDLWILDILIVIQRLLLMLLEFFTTRLIVLVASNWNRICKRNKIELLKFFAFLEFWANPQNFVYRKSNKKWTLKEILELMLATKNYYLICFQNSPLEGTVSSHPCPSAIRACSGCTRKLALYSKCCHAVQRNVLLWVQLGSQCHHRVWRNWQRLLLLVLQLLCRWCSNRSASELDLAYARSPIDNRDC